MDKALLEYLVNMFALIANMYPNLIFENVKDFLKSFLLKEFSVEVANENLRIFNGYYKKYSEIKISHDGIDKLNGLLQKTIEQKGVGLPKKQKFHILIRLLFFEKFLLNFISETTDKQILFSDILKLCVDNFHISEVEYLSTKGFIEETLYSIPEKKMILIVAKKKSFSLDLAFMQRDNFNGQLFFLYVESVSIILFYFKGNDALLFNDQPLYPGHIYLFHKGSHINGPNLEPVYYNQVLRRFLSNNTTNLVVQVKEIEYKFKNSNNGIHQLSLTLESAQLIGIIGRTGVGKSTLINILNGNIKPHKGTVNYNNFDLHKDNVKLDGLIGYVPQDDLLVEDLSVYTNLYLNAALCFGNLPKSELDEKVNNLLTDFDLYDVKNLKVGTPLNKFISGGQRKKLNIALELIREPSVLFADEPTSGLSSSDTEEIMHLLTGQTINGKIVIVNIHQPSSDIFKLFDKIIVLDKEGYSVYFGNPMDAISYFNNYTLKLSTAVDYCNVCENINPETIFKALEEKKVNEFGEYTSERKANQIEWHKRYLDNYVGKKEVVPESLPEIQYNKPKPYMQFLIFSKRNILSKIANRQYMLLALLISPLLAAILAFLCRSANQHETSGYVFAANDNMPSFFFMSVIVALFVGLIISAEEIIKDKKILLRESYLRLSKASYLNSKVVYLIALSAIQTFLYVVISNSILDIQKMTFNFWLVLFSTSCFANLAGLLISSLFDSIVVIYIMVPLIIVPQILLSGVVVGFDKLNDKVSSKEFVPFVGDLMVSRWAFEALVVSQFEYNDYQKHFFNEERIESNDKFNYLILIPEIKKVLFNFNKQINTSSYIDNTGFIKNEIVALNEIMPFKNIEGFSKGPMGSNKERVEKYLDILSAALLKRINRMGQLKDSISHDLVKKKGNVINFINFKNSNTNSSLTELVMKRKSLETFIIYNNKLIREMEPIYEIPGSKFGRAHFFSATKRVGNFEIETLIFNILAIWIMVLILYISLCYKFYLK
jgi:ABC-type multidrug transport system ATPase subunit